MVAETEIVRMSELNKIRTDRLANALKMKNGETSVSRSQSMRHRPNNSSSRSELKSPAQQKPAAASGRFFANTKNVDDELADLEFRRRACTLPSKERMPFSPSIYSKAATNLSPRSPSGQNVTVNSLQAPVLSSETVDGDESVFVERMRTFTLDPDKAAVVNRGDSFRCRSNTSNFGSSTPNHRRLSLNGSSKNSSTRSSRSHSPVPFPIGGVADVAPNSTELLSPNTVDETVRKYHIIVLGSAGVGKSSMINQFMTSEYCNPFQNESRDHSDENTVNVLLDGEESQLTFIEVDNEKSDMWLSLAGAGYIVAYSVDNLASFRNAEKVLYELRQRTQTSRIPIVLVANKIDLERKRHVSADEGKQIAKECNCKFVEIAVALGHHVDELLVGVLAQARLNEFNEATPSCPGSKSELIAAFDSLFPIAVQVGQGRTSSGSSCESANGGGGVGHGFRFGKRRHHKQVQNIEKDWKQNGMEKCNSLKRLDDAVSSGCSHISSVGGKFVQKLFGRRRRSHSLENLLAFQRR